MMSVHALLLPELDDLIMRGSPQRQAKILERVTAFFLGGASSFNEHHIQVFDLVLARLIDRIDSKARTRLSSRLAPLGNPPLEAVRRLARDDSIAVAAPVLKRAARLSETDLIDIIATKSQGHLLAISARPGLAERVTDGLLQRGNQEVLRCLADNRAARFSDDGFCFLVEPAETDGILAEKTLLRGDIPPRLFHELLLTATDAVQRQLLAWATAEAIIKRRPGSTEISSQDLGTARVDFDLLCPIAAQRTV